MEDDHCKNSQHDETDNKDNIPHFEVLGFNKLNQVPSVVTLCDTDTETEYEERLKKHKKKKKTLCDTGTETEYKERVKKHKKKKKRKTNEVEAKAA